MMFIKVYAQEAFLETFGENQFLHFLVSHGSYLFGIVRMLPILLLLMFTWYNSYCNVLIPVLVLLYFAV